MCLLQTDCAGNKQAVALAELRLGRALAAEPGHDDRDAYGAAKARSFMTAHVH